MSKFETFDVWHKTNAVSWQPAYECPEGGSESLKASGRTIKIYEAYTTKKGNHVAKEVFVTLSIEEMRGLAKYLEKEAGRIEALRASS